MTKQKILLCTLVLTNILSIGYIIQLKKNSLDKSHLTKNENTTEIVLKLKGKSDKFDYDPNEIITYISSKLYGATKSTGWGTLGKQCVVLNITPDVHKLTDRITNQFLKENPNLIRRKYIKICHKSHSRDVNGKILNLGFTDINGINKELRLINEKGEEQLSIDGVRLRHDSRVLEEIIVELKLYEETKFFSEVLKDIKRIRKRQR